MMSCMLHKNPIGKICSRIRPTLACQIESSNHSLVAKYLMGPHPWKWNGSTLLSKIIRRIQPIVSNHPPIVEIPWLSGLEVSHAHPSTVLQDANSPFDRAGSSMLSTFILAHAQLLGMYNFLADPKPWFGVSRPRNSLTRSPHHEGSVGFLVHSV